MTVLSANAKLTWSLRVVGGATTATTSSTPRWSPSISPTRSPSRAAAEVDAHVSGPFADGVPTDEIEPGAARPGGVDRTATVHVDKADPHGGGLGGGSADAAAILRWAGVDDPNVAVGLGADVPFCLVGGRARVTGIGEIVDPLPPVERIVTLVVPPLHVSTPAVYRAWDDLGGPTADGPNDLEPAALLVEPRLATWRDRVGELSGQVPRLAGSGSSWFVEGKRDDALGALSGEGATVVVCRTAP